MIDFQAVVLAAGKGSRMSDLVACEDFKCNIQIANKPMLFYPLRNLKNAGFTDVLVVVPNKFKPDEKIASELTPLRIEYASVNIDSEEQGTAESLRLIKDKLKPNKFLLVVSCDLITDIDLSELCLKQRISDALMTILLAPLPSQLTESSVPGSKKKYQAERDIIVMQSKENRLLQFGAAADYVENVSFRLKLLRQFPNMDVHSDLIDCHVYALHPKAVEFIIQNKQLATLKGEVIPKLIKKQFSNRNLQETERSVGDTIDSLRCYAVISSNFALRANTIQGYKIANGEVQNICNDLFPAFPGTENLCRSKPNFGTKVTAKKNVMGSKVVVGNQCMILSSVLHDDIVIGDGTVIQNSIICRGSRIGKGCNITNSFVGVRMQLADARTVKDESVGISNMEFE